jgi:hypothetical protein
VPLNPEPVLPSNLSVLERLKMTAHRRNAPAQASIKNDETLMSVPEQEVSRILPLSEITGKKIRPLRGTCKIVEPVGEV